jgi:alpha-mannosidase/mannosylglycerate hydrolase
VKRRKVHFVLGTHWDREWHHTFQDFRYYLVKLFDGILEGWENGSLKGPFQTDGQAIIIEDYLEIHPEKRPLIEKHAREGRLVIGPWYVMPDEFCVSGESLIRNLQLGKKIARSYGGTPSSAGYMCDIFGHISQMPQILDGFKIPLAFLWRGTNPDGKRNLLWEGADGTEIAVYRFGGGAYCDYATNVRRAHDHSEFEYDLEVFFERLEKFLEKEAKSSDVSPLLAYDGGDHLAWDQEAYHLLQQWAALDHPDFEFVHSSLDGYLKEMLPQMDQIKTKMKGELREPGLEKPILGNEWFDVDGQWLIPGVLSSRVHLKQANNNCQTLLCHWAEPFSSMAHIFADIPYPKGYLDVAWRWLIQNHPHDSIDACSIDQVHKDMEYRFDQSLQISSRLTTEAIRSISANVVGEVTENQLRVSVFNPLPRNIRQVVEIPFEIPSDWATFNENFGYEPKPSFRIYDSQDNELAYQRLEQKINQTRLRMRATKFPQGVSYNLIKVALPLEIPALGYTTLTVKSGYKGEYTRHPNVPSLALSQSSMGNEYIKVDIKSNGTVAITDHTTGQVYKHLLAIEDQADIGDGWYFGESVNDQVFSSILSSGEVALIQNGPFQATILLRLNLFVPEKFDFKHMYRSEKKIPLAIEHYLTLRKGQDYLEVETFVENTAQDHRLRILFPSGAKTDTYLADSAFDVVERAITLRADNHLYREMEVETKPQQSWTAVFDEQRGLAVISSGLLESAVRDLPDRTLALTLLRSTKKTVGTVGEPGGQEQGRLNFRYWILPIHGSPDRTRLCEMGQQVSNGLKFAQMQPEDVHIYTTDPILPPKASFLCLEGPAVITSLQWVNDGLEVRMFNPLMKTSQNMIRIKNWPEKVQKFQWVQPVNFESSPQGDRKSINQAIELEPKQILTVRLS